MPYSFYKFFCQKVPLCQTSFIHKTDIIQVDILYFTFGNTGNRRTEVSSTVGSDITNLDVPHHAIGGIGALLICLRPLLAKRIYSGHSVPSINILLTVTPSITPPSTTSRDIAVIPVGVD